LRPVDLADILYLPWIYRVNRERIRKGQGMRIVLASAQLDLRLALEILLREEPGTDIVGTASETASVRSLLQSSLPDLFILDWDLPGYALIQLLAEARRLRRCPQIIVLGREGARQEALAAGADAFVFCGDLPGDLTAAILQSRARHRDGIQTAALLPGATPQAADSGRILEGTKEE
jgi:DNA-binding NarL/FixJ family response regulator